MSDTRTAGDLHEYLAAMQEQIQQLQATVTQQQT